MACSCSCGPKAIVWSVWGFNLFVSCVYLGLSITSYYNVKTGSDRFQNPNADVILAINGILASCIIGFLIVLFWQIYSFIVLLARLFGDADLSYGIMLGAGFNTAWFMLLAGLVLQSGEDWPADAFARAGVWDDTDLSAYKATYGFSYILTGTFIITAIIMWWCRKYVGRAAAYEDKPPAAASSNALSVALSQRGTNV